METDLEQLKERAERLEQLAKEEKERRELKKRIRIAQATLREDTLVSKLFIALKKRAVGEIKNAVN